MHSTNVSESDPSNSSNIDNSDYDKDYVPNSTSSSEADADNNEPFLTVSQNVATPTVKLAIASCSTSTKKRKKENIKKVIQLKRNRGHEYTIKSGKKVKARKFHLLEEIC